MDYRLGSNAIWIVGHGGDSLREESPLGFQIVDLRALCGVDAELANVYGIFCRLWDE